MRVFPSVARVAQKYEFSFPFGSPSVPLRLSFGYPSVLRVVYKFLKSDSWNLPQKIHPAPDQHPLQPGRPQKLLNGPLVTKGLTMKISFGFPSVPLRFRGYVILETFGPPGANWIWGELKLPEAVLNEGSLTREKR